LEISNSSLGCKAQQKTSNWTCSSTIRIVFLYGENLLSACKVQAKVRVQASHVIAFHNAVGVHPGQKEFATSSSQETQDFRISVQKMGAPQEREIYGVFGTFGAGIEALAFDASQGNTAL
jgi:hypothetical protein